MDQPLCLQNTKAFKAFNSVKSIESLRGKEEPESKKLKLTGL